MIYFDSDLHFQMWDFHVSYSRLLLRSPRDESDDDSVDLDVTFTAVFYSELGCHLQGIVIRDATPDEIEYLHRRIAEMYFNHARCYVIVSGNYTYFVVGGNIAIETSQLRTRLLP